MTDAFLIYALFALTTTLAACYEIFIPVINKRNAIEKIEYKHLYYISLVSVALLTAPLMFISVIVPSAGEEFRQILYEQLFETTS